MHVSGISLVGPNKMCHHIDIEANLWPETGDFFLAFNNEF